MSLLAGLLVAATGTFRAAEESRRAFTGSLDPDLHIVHVSAAYLLLCTATTADEVVGMTLARRILDHRELSNQALVA